LSHFKERAEKSCLNCNTEVQGRFCHVCGQENVEPKETVWGLVSHFFHDITHFDGKFFTSLKWLMIRPGFLSKEYIIGRRARHLNPIRMYVFTAAVFFSLFFSFFFNVKDLTVKNSSPKKSNSSNIIIPAEAKEEALAVATDKKDSDRVERGYRYVNSFADSGKGGEKTKKTGIKIDSARKADSTVKEASADKEDGIRYNYDDDDSASGFNLFYNTDKYRSVGHYDSLQQALPSDQRDGWFTRSVKRKEIHLSEKIKKEGAPVVFTQLLDKFMHSFPQILFLSLPLIALILHLLYIRRRKQFYYVNHGIFLIHIYIYSFINLLVFFSLGKLGDAMGWTWMPWIQSLLGLHALWYVYKAMRNFYGQGRLKTFAKFFLLNTFTIVVIDILFIIFFLFSAWNL
jgi:hypothetical protein